jgi:ATP-binding cassette subfamily B protein
MYLNYKISKSITSDLVGKIFNTYIFQNYEEISGFKSHKIVAAVTDKIEMFANVLFYFFSLLISIMLSLCIISSLIFFSNINIILTLIIFVSFLYLSLIFFSKKKLKNYSIYLNDLSDKRVKNLQDCLNNYKNIILANSMNLYSKFFFDLDYNFRQTQAKISMIATLPRFLIEALFIITIVLITYIFLENSNYDNSKNIIISVGVIVFGLQKLLPIFQQIYTAFTILTGNMGMISDIEDSIKKYEISENKRINKITQFKSLDLKNISFRYKGKKDDLIKNFNCSINQCDKIGIIGKSGSGKSTLVDIIMGLLKPSDGKLILNNNEMNFQDDKIILRGNFSHVPQNYFMLNNSIVDNIVFSFRDDSKSYDETLLKKATNVSELDEFIKNLPEGINTIIGDKGLNISGGQRQRIALARALYQNKNILVLDEATSSLDETTEEKIIKKIEEIYPNLTILFVTHKKTLKKNFNKLINLDEI